MSDESHLQQAYAFHQSRRYREAEQAYREVLVHSPTSMPAVYGLAILAAQTGDDRRAIELLEQTLGLSPHHAEAYSNLGMILARNQRLKEAQVCLERSLEIEPASAAAWNNLGEIQQKQGNLEASQLSLTRSLQLDPELVEAHNNLGVLYQRQHDHARASLCFQQALEKRPNFFLALYNQAVSYDALGSPTLAICICQKAVQLRADDAELWSLLGKIYLNQGQMQPAYDALRTAIQLDPKCLKALLNLAMVYQSCGQHDLALRIYRRAHTAWPKSVEVAIGLANQMQWNCDWEGLDGLCTMIIDEVERDPAQLRDAFVPPFWFLSLAKPTSSKQQLTVAQMWAERFAQKRLEPFAPASLSPARQRLRIGYVSADFGEHATTWLIGDLFASHDRERFEVFGYSFQRGPSHQRQQIEATCDAFFDITTLSHREAAEKIRRDQIDILVDLKGYTQYARPEIFGMRPAPIQVAYLGYPGTMGASFIDYAIVDDFVVPADRQPFYAEHLVALPGCYQVNVPATDIDEAPLTRQSHGLPENGIVFCAFNNPFKLTPLIFDIWMRLLYRTPDSVLWLLGDNATMQMQLQHESRRRGIDASRLVFAPRIPHAQHLACHRLADLFLDTFPYNAHTTASDALRMGVPVVTMIGETFSSRVAGSLLRTLGLSDCIVDNTVDYERLATDLATHRDLLERYRTRLKVGLRSSDLYDSKAFAGKLENAYRFMWLRHSPGGSKEVLD